MITKFPVFSVGVSPARKRPTKESIMKEKVQAALNKIRPILQADGGDVELVEITDKGVVKVRLQGACRGCPMSQMTLKNGVERAILKEVPEVKSVEAV
jgi:Fe-S cluster biogenesis protein NfuA